MANQQTSPGELFQHFSVVVYPFLHEVTENQTSRRLSHLAARWQPWWNRLSDEEVRESLDSSDYYLPYVQKLLFPETGPLAEHASGTWTATLRQATQLPLPDFVATLGRESVVRLTLRPEFFEPISHFHLEAKPTASMPEPEALPALFRWVDVILFPTGLGFLLLKTRVEKETRTFDDLLRLNRGLQAVEFDFAPTLAWGEHRFYFRDLINYLLQGFMDDEHVGAQTFPGAWEHPETRTGYTDSEYGRAFGRTSHLLSFACVHVTEDQRAGIAKGAFDAGEDRILFEFANGNLLGQSVDNPVWVPSQARARYFARDHVWSPWRCWRAMFLRESLVFLATENLWFTRKTLPRTIENDYLPLYLFTLFQKFQLYLFANDLMVEVAMVRERLAGAKSLLRRFIAFRNRYWFAEVTRKPQGGELYRLLHQGLEIGRLYEMVTTTVKEAKEYYQDQWDRQLQGLVKLVGFVAGPAVAMYGGAHVFLGKYLGAEPNSAWALAAMVAGIAVVSGTLIWQIWNSPPKCQEWKTAAVPPPITPIPPKYGSLETFPQVAPPRSSPPKAA